MARIDMYLVELSESMRDLDPDDVTILKYLLNDHRYYTSSVLHLCALRATASPSDVQLERLDDIMRSYLRDIGKPSASGLHIHLHLITQSGYFDRVASFTSLGRLRLTAVEEFQVLKRDFEAGTELLIQANQAILNNNNK